MQGKLLHNYINNYAATTCRTARLDPGCCFGLTFSACHVTAGNCYCDLLCHLYNDCCTDVDRSRLCIPQGKEYHKLCIKVVIADTHADAETEGKAALGGIADKTNIRT